MKKVWIVGIIGGAIWLLLRNRQIQAIPPWPLPLPPSPLPSNGNTSGSGSLPIYPSNSVVLTDNTEIELVSQLYGTQTFPISQIGGLAALKNYVNQHTLAGYIMVLQRVKVDGIWRNVLSGEVTLTNWIQQDISAEFNRIKSLLESA